MESSRKIGLTKASFTLFLITVKIHIGLATVTVFGAQLCGIKYTPVAV